jgi:nucleotide-binding universal stress UspA family protein
MVAWKTGRESVRSLNDAMPHIEKARHVTVICASTEVNSLDSERHMVNVRNFLARHGVSCRTDQVYIGNLSLGDKILNLACEQSADLLVMGAYAPTRRGTLDLSPAARHVLRHLTLPVLLSH